MTLQAFSGLVTLLLVAASAVMLVSSYFVLFRDKLWKTWFWSIVIWLLLAVLAIVLKAAGV